MSSTPHARVPAGRSSPDLSADQVRSFLAEIEAYLRGAAIAPSGERDGRDARGGPAGRPGRSTRRAAATRGGSIEARPNASGADAVRTYLRDITRIPLLSAAEEVDLAMRIEAGASATALLSTIGAPDGWRDRTKLSEIVGSVIALRERQVDRPIGSLTAGSDHGRRSAGDAPSGDGPRSGQELIELVARVERDGRLAKRRLTEANLRLVVMVAKRYRVSGMPLLDLIQEGNLGLIRAVELFDWRLGNKFSTYATWWIRHAIARSIPDQARAVRIPVHMHEAIHRMGRVEQQLTQELGRTPTNGEIAASMELSGGRIRDLQRSSQDPVSLQTPVGEDGSSSLDEMIPDQAAVAPDDAAAYILLQEQLEAVLDSLSDRERLVIRLRFGLVDGRPWKLEEIGRELGVTRERIRQLEVRALAKLRHFAKPLRGYLG